MLAYKNKYEEANLAIKILLVLFLLVGGNYFLWRFTTLNPDAWILSCLLLLAELYGISTGIIHIMMTWRLTVRWAPDPQPGLTADVFIPTYNEPIEIVRRTLSAAVAMDYLHETWLLDDGNRPEMRELALSLGAKYLARDSSQDAKAGNLNYGLQHATGQFVAIFDADHVPNKNFLLRTLGYFSDDQVAFVQTPQDFYNTDSFQHRANSKRGLVWTEQSLFFQVIQRGKDYWNAAFFCGSCAIVRRAALDKIGGFATGTITEDLHTSIKLHKQGYKSVYHSQALAFGIAPSTMEPFITQRIRWGQGAMQVWKKEGLLFAKGLTWPQRINYFASVITYFDGWQKGLLYFIPVVTLLTGMMPVRSGFYELLIHLLPYIFLNYLLFEELARGYGQSLYIEQYNMARFYAFALATLTLFTNKDLKFKVTKKEKLITSKTKYLLPQVFVFYLNLFAIPFGALLFYFFGHLPQDAFLICIFWACVNVLLSRSLIKFSNLKNNSHRVDHRFNLPHVACLNMNEHDFKLLMVTNISYSGCKLVGQLPHSPKVGDVLKFSLYMPRIIVDLEAEIKHIVYDQLNSEYEIGCLFVQGGVGHLLLEKYLFGSDHQWTFNNLSERDLTPLERLQSCIFRGNQKEVYFEHDWYPLLSIDRDVLGIIARNKINENAFRLVLNDEPPDEIDGRILFGEKDRQIQLKNLSVRRVDNPSYPYFLCEYQEVRRV